GAGYTSFPDGNEYPFLVSDVASDIMQLVNTIWPHRSFSICGYSYGAIVGLHLKPKLPILEHLILIDPPLIDAPNLKSRITERLPLTHIVQVLLEKEDPNEGLIAFADVVLPHRKRHPKIENSLLQRLSFRPKGLAYCLNCINQAALDLPCPSKLSQLENVHVLLAESRGMKSINSIKEQIPDWHVSYLNGTTHALPFQKPEKTAQFITRVLTNLN
ncbi:MAG: alpha/beta hydrolase, partial [Pseudomonadota bacterium]|nr:alpha/beta hydrolase [Pseudomonadota bacterium]